MVSLTIDLNAEAAVKALRLAPKRVERATMRALNRALKSGRAEMARLVAKDMGMKVGDAKEAVLAREATPSRLSASLQASKKRRPLKDFKAKQTGRGVTFVGQGGKRQLVPGAFLSGVQTGHVGTKHDGVFMRRTKKRLPIQELYGVSIGHIFEKHRDAVTQVIREAFEKNLAHELRFASTENA